MVKAKWKVGIFRADANLVAEEILAIGEEVKPEQIVEKARDETTELHKCFEWDDSKAAENYRKIQAGQILRFLVIKEEKKPENRPEVRFFFKPEQTHNSGYKSTIKIVRNDDEYKNLLAQAWTELRAFKSKYSMLEELREILDLID